MHHPIHVLDAPDRPSVPTKHNCRLRKCCHSLCMARKQLRYKKNCFLETFLDRVARIGIVKRLNYNDDFIIFNFVNLMRYCHLVLMNKRKCDDDDVPLSCNRTICVSMLHFTKPIYTRVMSQRDKRDIIVYQLQCSQPFLRISYYIGLSIIGLYCYLYM